MKQEMFKVKSIRDAIAEELIYVDKLRKGLIYPTNTGFRFMNGRMLGGLHRSDIFTLGGKSGTGKTAFAVQLVLNLARLNTKVRICYMTFEMPGRKLIARMVSSHVKKTLRQLYAKDCTIGDSAYKQFADLEIDFVETPITPSKIEAGMDDYCEKYPGFRCIFIFDHSLLIQNHKGSNNMDTLIETADMLNYTKKRHDRAYIIISQLNDAMSKIERLAKPAGHYPNETDLYGSRAILHVSDNITILINPSRLNLQYNSYGTHKLPMYLPYNGVNYEAIYAHTIKARDGEPGIDPLLNGLKHNTLTEFSQEEYDRFVSHYKLVPDEQ